MQSLGQNYEHITFVSSKRILYKGHTPRAELLIRKENYLQSENLDILSILWGVCGVKIFMFSLEIRILGSLRISGRERGI